MCHPYLLFDPLLYMFRSLLSQTFSSHVLSITPYIYAVKGDYIWSCSQNIIISSFTQHISSYLHCSLFTVSRKLLLYTLQKSISIIHLVIFLSHFIAYVYIAWFCLLYFKCAENLLTSESDFSPYISYILCDAFIHVSYKKKVEKKILEQASS